MSLSANTSLDNGSGSIFSSTDGSILGGSVNYVTGEIIVQVDSIGGYALVTVLGQPTSSRNLPAGTEDLTFMLAAPLLRNKLVVTIGGVQVTTDNGVGGFVLNLPIVGGTVNYITGQIELKFATSSVTQSITLTGQTEQILRPVPDYVNDPDLDFNQPSNLLGGITSVAYVKNSSFPIAAQITDQDLFRRDLVLIEVLELADSIFTQLNQGAFDDSDPNPTIPSNTSSGGTLTNVWSQADASSQFSLPRYSVDWGTGPFLNSDSYLAYRDNILAKYTAALSKLLSSTLNGQSTLAVIGTQSGIPIRVSDSTTTPDAPVPSGACFSSSTITVGTDTISQSGNVLTFSSINVINTIQLGDKVLFGSSIEEVYEIINSSSCKVFPSQTVSSASAIVQRDVAILDVPRALRVSPATWSCRALGFFQPFEYAKKLTVRVKDSSVEEYLQSTSLDTVISAVGCQGLSGANQNNVATLLTSWNPKALIFLGNSNFYEINSGTFSSNNSPYLGFITEELVCPCVGGSDYYPSSQTGEDLSEYLEFFTPPGNGRYYSKLISDDLEVFVLNTGWNEGQAAAALLNPNLFSTQEPDGISSSSVQALWLQSALQSSSATWKIVVIHYPPYSSSSSINDSYPGWAQFRWPFKEWGANLVLSSHIRAYERLIVDGMTYVVSGTGADATEQYSSPTSLGSMENTGTDTPSPLGGLKIVANPSYLQVTAYTTSASLDQLILDNVIFWSDPLAQDYLKSGFNSDSVPKTGAVTRYQDTEYSALGDRFLARIPRQEAEDYVLLSDNERYRTFSAVPILPTNLKTITYDKWLKSVQWRSLQVGDFPSAQFATQLFGGQRPSQQVEILSDFSGTKDSDFWRQKAAQLQTSPCNERTVFYNNFLAQPGIPYFYSELQSLASPVEVENNPVIVLGPGQLVVPNIPIISPLAGTQAQWFQVNLLFQPTSTWYRAAATFDSLSSIGAIVIDEDGVSLDVPSPSSGNVSQSNSNSPTVAWKLNLPIGNYKLQAEWQDLNSVPADFFVTVRWGTQILFSGTWTAAQALTSELSPSFTLTSSGIVNELTITFNSPVTTSGIKISRILFQMLTVQPSDSYRVNVNFYDPVPDGVDQDIPAQYSRFVGDLDIPEVVSTVWIGADVVGQRSGLNFKINLLDVPNIPLVLVGIEVRTRLKVEPIPGWSLYQNYKPACLQEAIHGLAKAYSTLASSEEFRVQDSSAFSWNENTTTAWLDQISTVEPRLKLAFRTPTPGDVGQPALVPSGVYLSGGRVVSAGSPQSCFPYLAPWQPWMYNLGFLVAVEDFWNIPVPAKPTQLLLIDPTGEDVINFSSQAPSLIFTNSTDSQYCVLI